MSTNQEIRQDMALYCMDCLCNGAVVFCPACYEVQADSYNPPDIDDDGYVDVPDDFDTNDHYPLRKA